MKCRNQLQAKTLAILHKKHRQ